MDVQRSTVEEKRQPPRDVKTFSEKNLLIKTWYHVRSITANSCEIEAAKQFFIPYEYLGNDSNSQAPRLFDAKLKGAGCNGNTDNLKDQVSVAPSSGRFKISENKRTLLGYEREVGGEGPYTDKETVINYFSRMII